MMFSQNNQTGAVNPDAAVYGEVNGAGHLNQAGAVNPDAAVYGEVNGGGHLNQPSTRPPRDAYQNLKPKAIKRMAAPHEIRMLIR